jgi:uncharacterized repeat protein (TIGR03943 family)
VRVGRLVRPGLLTVLAIILTWNVLSGQLLLYVNERMTWVVALTVPMLLGMAAADVLGVRLTGGGRSSVIAIAVPVLLAVLVPARPLGASALDTRDGATARPRSATIAVPELLDVNTRLLPRSLPELALLRTGELRLSNVDGERAELTGFVARQPGLAADEVLVARFIMLHCTADAYAVSVPIRYAGAGELPDDTWVHIEGTVRAGGPEGNRQAVVEADSVRVIPQPRQPYLSA